MCDNQQEQQKPGGKKRNRHYEPSARATAVLVPNDADVLCGRGNDVKDHPGNVQFRQLVLQHKVAYVTCSKAQKAEYAKDIVGTLQREYGARFLQKMNGSWFEIEHKHALDKTRQALREGAPIIEEHLKKEKEQRTKKAATGSAKATEGGGDDERDEDETLQNNNNKEDDSAAASVSGAGSDQEGRGSAGPDGDSVAAAGPAMPTADVAKALCTFHKDKKKPAIKRHLLPPDIPQRQQHPSPQQQQRPAFRPPWDVLAVHPGMKQGEGDSPEERPNHIRRRLLPSAEQQEEEQQSRPKQQGRRAHTPLQRSHDLPAPPAIPQHFGNSNIIPPSPKHEAEWNETSTALAVPETANAQEVGSNALHRLPPAPAFFGSSLHGFQQQHSNAGSAGAAGLLLPFKHQLLSPSHSSSQPPRQPLTHSQVYASSSLQPQTRMLLSSSSQLQQPSQQPDATTSLRPPSHVCGTAPLESYLRVEGTGAAAGHDCTQRLLALDASSLVGGSPRPPGSTPALAFDPLLGTIAASNAAPPPSSYHASAESLAYHQHLFRTGNHSFVASNHYRCNHPSTTTTTVLLVSTPSVTQPTLLSAAAAMPLFHTVNSNTTTATAGSSGAPPPLAAYHLAPASYYAGGVDIGGGADRTGSSLLGATTNSGAAASMVAGYHACAAVGSVSESVLFPSYGFDSSSTGGGAGGPSFATSGGLFPIVSSMFGTTTGAARAGGPPSYRRDTFLPPSPGGGNMPPRST